MVVEPTRDERIEAALLMVSHGFACFALRPRSKEPWTPEGFKDATRDEDRIRKFLSNPGATSYGIVYPETDDDLVTIVLDVDGEGWREKIDALVQRLGPLPLTRRTKSPNGYHVFFQVRREVAATPGNKMFGFVVRKPWKGYVLGPGSVTDAGVYTASGPNTIAILPDAWQEEALKQAKPAKPLISVPAQAGGYELPEVVGDGDRYEAIVKYTAHLYNTGISPTEMEALVRSQLLPRMRPPLDEQGFTERYRRATSGMEKRLGERHTPGVRATVGARDDFEYEVEPPRLGEFPAPPSKDLIGSTGVAMVVGELMQQTTASKVGLAATFLAIWGGMFGVHFDLYEGQPTNLFAILVGDTGSGRKGTTTRKTWRVFEDTFAPQPGQIGVSIYDQRWDGLASGQGFIRQMKDAAIKRGVAIEEEFEGVLRGARSNNNYASTLGITIQKAFDGAMLQHITVRGSLKVEPGYTVGIVGNITRSVLRLVLPPEFISGGFANRMLWLPVEERSDETVDLTKQGLTSSTMQYLRECRSFAQRNPEITLQQESRDLVQDYYTYLQSLTGIASQFARRFHVIAARVGAIHAVLDQTKEIEPEHIMAGIALTEYSRRGLVWTFTDDSGDEWLDTVVEALRAAGANGLASKVINRMLQNHAPRIRRVRTLGTEGGLITIEKVPSDGGRPSLVWKHAQNDPLKDFDRTQSTSKAPHTHAGSPASRGDGTGAQSSKASKIDKSPTEPLSITDDPSTTPLQNEDQLNLTLDNSPASDEHGLTCHFYREHSSIHRRAACGSFHCDTCSPYPEGHDDGEA